jgi:eukaryotic-like serine/threonine-protein kinase
MRIKPLLCPTALATALALLAACGADRAAPTAAIPSGVSVVGATVRTSYTGQCPPNADQAPSFTAIISVPNGPTTVTYQWLTSHGTSTDPSPHVLDFPGGGPQYTVVTFTETGYLPDQTLADWIAIYIRSPRTTESNHLAFTTSCHTGRPHRYDPNDSATTGTVLH